MTTPEEDPPVDQDALRAAAHRLLDAVGDDTVLARRLIDDAALPPPAVRPATEGRAVSDHLDAIAESVADLHAGRVKPYPLTEPDVRSAAAHVTAAAGLVPKPIVDATRLYWSLPEGRAVPFDALCVTPPWERAIIAYRAVGRVIVNQIGPADRATWGRSGFVSWCWSRDLGGSMYGPFGAELVEVTPSGGVGEYGFIGNDDFPSAFVDTNAIVVLSVLNFLNCRNIALVDAPVRDRAQRRRLDRLGVRVSTLNVFAAGETRRTDRAGDPVGGVPLTSVRGHFAHYGPQYDRALLFGKYEGRFYVPQHARGSADLGEVEQRFVLHPEEATG
jgi:hypothetical protein